MPTNRSLHSVTVLDVPAGTAVGTRFGPYLIPISLTPFSYLVDGVFLSNRNHSGSAPTGIWHAELRADAGDGSRIFHLITSTNSGPIDGDFVNFASTNILLWLMSSGTGVQENSFYNFDPLIDTAIEWALVCDGAPTGARLGGGQIRPQRIRAMGSLDFSTAKIGPIALCRCKYRSSKQNACSGPQ
jgi:hypothetical protein